METRALFWGYTIREDGQVTAENGHRVPARANNKGYPQVWLGERNNRSMYLVHRLVAHTFVPNPRPDIFDQVDHIDGKPLNSHKSNLRWVNRALNMLNLHKAKNAYYIKRWKKWLARVRRTVLGYYKTEEEAIERSRAYRAELFQKTYEEFLNSPTKTG